MISSNGVGIDGELIQIEDLTPAGHMCDLKTCHRVFVLKNQLQLL